MSILEAILNNIMPGGNRPEVPLAGRSPLEPSAPNANAAKQNVSFDEIMRAMDASNTQKLDWRHSIVDLMKLVGLDSSPSARKALARELNYTGDMNDSATMNVWLHEQVMAKLKENGGVVPESLKN